MIEQIFIFLISAILLFITLTPNAIHALLALIILFINFSFLLFSVGAPFLALSYVLVYIGAICVLFLYVILLLNIRSFSIAQRKVRHNIIIFIIFLVWCALIYYCLPLGNLTVADFFNPERVNDLALFGYYLYNFFSIYLLYSMFFLLLALILAIFVSVTFIKDNHYETINAKISSLFEN